MSESCFHCSLPIASGLDIRYSVLGEERRFCCHGCQMVCQTIVEGGYESFYAHRDTTQVIDAQVLPSVLKDLTLYDRPEIQRSFVSYQGQVAQASLILENIRCAACLWLNEQHLLSLEGVVGVDLDYTTHHAQVRWQPEKIALSQILEAISAIGYIAHPYDPHHRKALLDEERHRSIERLLFAGLLGMQVMAFSIATYWMGGYAANGQLPLWEVIGRWSTLLVTGVMLVYSGADFYVGAWRDLRQRRLGMDVPVVLGLTVAWLGSLWATWVNDEAVYYDSIGMFIFFVLLARVYELKGRMAATDMLDRLMRIRPQSVACLRDGEWVNLPVLDVVVGDHIRLLAGETVPLDGDLVSAQAMIHEAHLTGESVPIQRQQGDWIRAGSMSLDQTLEMRVGLTDHDSTMNQLQKLMSTAMAEKPALAQLANRLSAPFVGIVLVVALLTLGFWYWFDESQALSNFIAVLIITCPCALALATPVALALAAGRMVQGGIVPIHLNALEAISHVNLLVVDKTGTLTEGRPRIVDCVLFGSRNEVELSIVAASMEQTSLHPLAYAFTLPANADMLSVDASHFYPSEGVEARIAGDCWRIGRLSFAVSSEHELGSLKEKLILIADDKIQVALSCNGQLQAIFLLEDPLRDDVERFIQQSKQHGIQKVVMLSGDRQVTVSALARKLKLDDAVGDLTPQGKLEWIQQQQASGKKVLMIGDGLNDAPTLAAADVSFSFSVATDLAQLHSDFVLMGHRLLAVWEVKRLAEKTQSIIRQNLIWALAYNLIAVPFAAFGMITPWMAAIGMSVSSLWVVFNAMRLKNKVLTIGNAFIGEK